MKKYLIKSFLIIVLFTLLNAICFFTYADNTINLDIMDESFGDQFYPASEEDETELSRAVSNPIIKVLTLVINKVLGLLQWVGIILTVLSMTYFGLNILLTQLSFNNDLGLLGGGKMGKVTKKEIEAYMRHLLIGSILLLSSTTVVKVVWKILLLE